MTGFPDLARHAPIREHVHPREHNQGDPRPPSAFPICLFNKAYPNRINWHVRCFLVDKSIECVHAHNPPKDDPMSNANPELLFFAYLVIVVALCPICEMVTNRLSHK
jgi:hypothetical protein